jgi:formylglycine-generating enzyme
MLLSFALLIAPIAALAQTPFRDCPECPAMLAIPAGSFPMGVAAGEEEREAVPEPVRGQSAPLHKVTIRAFALGQHEVTRGEFMAFVRDTRHGMGDSCTALALKEDKTGYGFREVAGRNWRHTGFAQTDQDPVVCVSWNDAKAYLRWLAGKTGRAYRLPSEAEWEYAARAGAAGARPWGDGRGEACRFGNLRDLALLAEIGVMPEAETHFACEDGHAHTAPVGRFAPNAFGLHDMLGNVWEWVEDCWNANYLGAPTDGTAWTKGECGRRVARGGSWASNPRDVRSGFRLRDDATLRAVFSGLRVARDM